VSVETLERSIDELMSDYLAGACPCRFPRFRATVGRDITALFGVAEYTNPEQEQLIARFDARVALTGRSPTRTGWRGFCARCNGEIVREDIEGEREPASHLFITPGPAPDVGAPFEGAIPRVYGFYPLGRAAPSQLVVAQLNAAYPLMSEEHWLAWMRARQR